MAKYEHMAFKPFGKNVREAVGRDGCASGFTVGWAGRARRRYVLAAIACAMLMADAAAPAIAAVGPADMASDEAARAVYRSMEAYGPEYMEVYGPEHIETFGPDRMEVQGPPWEATDGLEALPVEEAVEPLSGNEIARTAANGAAVGAAVTDGSEYPVAVQVYNRLAAAGWSDICIAGVLGNMMTECGGQTLALQPYCEAWDDGVKYYGLCQWSMAYNDGVDGMDVDGQLDYLFGNIERNMAYFGGDGAYGRWLSSSDAAQAARDFCGWYERGAGTERRAANAVMAYDWIASLK